MFIPIGDAPNPKGTPFVTYGLIAANVAVYLLFNVPLGAQRADVRDPAFREYVEVVSRQLDDRADLRRLVANTSEYDLFAFEHGYRPASPRLSALLTCMFLHGGLMHLLGNMLFLWIYGDNVEKRLGALPYLVAYLATGTAATLSHALVFASSEMPLVGASGAISGVLGFYFVFFPRNTVRMLVFLPPFLMQVFVIPARFVLGMFLLLDNLLPILLAGEGGVAHGAHIGGFVVGAAAGWLLDRRSVDRAPPRFGAPEPPRGTDQVRGALAAGRHADAARAYFALPPALTAGAVSPGEGLELASWLRAHGHAEAALALLRRLVRDGRGEGMAEVHALAGAILLREMNAPTTAYQYLLTALELGPQPETEREVRGLLARIEALQKRRIGRTHSPPDW